MSCFFVSLEEWRATVLMSFLLLGSRCSGLDLASFIIGILLPFYWFYHPSIPFFSLLDFNFSLFCCHFNYFVFSFPLDGLSGLASAYCV
jgi:hypothetical protein